MSKHAITLIQVPADKLEHLLNCLDNTAYIDDLPQIAKDNVKRLTQTANHEMRAIWLEAGGHLINK